MDRRVFQPWQTNEKVHRRNGLGMAVAVLLGGWVALSYLKTQQAPPSASQTPAEPMAGPLPDILTNIQRPEFLLALGLLTVGYLYLRTQAKKAQRRRKETLL